MIRLSKKTKVLILSSILAMVLVLPSRFANAGFIVDFATGTIGSVITYIFYTLFYVIGQFTVIVVKLFDWLVYIRIDNGMPVIKQTWTILRDFSNMLFIVILVYMGFATIFDSRSNYRFEKLIWNLVIAAVLINFSLAIGGLVINMCQVLTNVFLTSIGNPGDRIGQYLDPAQLVAIPHQASVLSSIDILSAQGITLIAGVFLSGTFLFSLLTAVGFAAYRLFVIWALLMVSPVAWMAYILPGTRKWWSAWWGTFLGWNLFLPIYLFFMYLGLVFLSQRDNIVAAVGISNYGNTAPIPGMGSLTLNLIFFYVFAAFVMGYATWAAKRLTSNWGDGFEFAIRQSQGFINKYVPGFNTYQAARSAAQRRAGELFGGAGSRLPGALNRERQEAAFNRAFGVKGADIKAQKDAASKIEEEIKRLKDEERFGKLQVTRNFADNTDPLSTEGAARRMIMYERGIINPDNFASDMKQWVGKNPFLAESMLKSARSGGFKGIPATQLLQMAAAETGPGFDYSYLQSNAGIATRKDLYRALVGDKDIQGRDDALRNMTKTQLDEAVTLFGGDETNEADKYKKEIAKKRPDLVALHNAGVKGTTVETEYDELIKNKNKTDDYGDVLLPAWSDPKFQEAIKRKIDKANDPSTGVPGHPAGYLYPPGTPIPPGVRTFALGAPIPTKTQGFIDLGPKGILSIKPIGGRKGDKPIEIPGIPYKQNKGQVGAGDSFRAGLDKSTRNKPDIYRVVVNL